MMVFPNLCSSCVRKNDDNTCEAFPEGIPDDILVFGADHRKPHGGDHGLQYAPDPKSGELLVVWLKSNGLPVTG